MDPIHKSANGQWTQINWIELHDAAESNQAGRDVEMSLTKNID